MSAATNAVRFEVLGKVQGVFFRKYTKKMCDKLGLSGYVLNTKNGTVQGHMQGSSTAINKMYEIRKEWLRTKGSPKSRIDQCNFFDENVSDSYSHFSIITAEDEVARRTFST